MFNPKEILKAIADENDRSVGSILAMAPQNDPYNAGSPTDVAMGEWFADLWNSQKFHKGIHLRAIHYRVSHGSHVQCKHDGTRYDNTEEDWTCLNKASKAARYLGLVDAADFSDQRNPDPTENAPEPVAPDDPEWYIGEFDDLFISGIQTDLFARFELPGISVDGYDYDDGEQPYLLEVWAEKSTQNHILGPVCQRHGANFVTAMGYSSITSVVKLLQRAEAWIELRRPVRIFYVSDHDPAGDSMPRAVARQLQFWIEQFGIQADIKLNPLLLTADQVRQFSLPRKPIKASDKRKRGFEERHGTGAVELDALEGIHPGEMERILNEALSQYRDKSLKSRLWNADYAASRLARMEWSKALEGVEGAVDSLKNRAQVILNKYRPKLAELSNQMESELGPIRKELESLQDEIKEHVEGLAGNLFIELPERPVANVPPPDESGWLFDSTRDHMEQLQHFQLHKGA